MIKRGVTLVVVAILALGILGTPVVAAAQQARKVARVGVLGTALQSQNLEALRKGLRELGWIEGQNLLLEIRIFEGQSAPLGALATELVDLKVDLIFTADSAAAHAARNATGTVPIVGASLGDAVRSGLIASLARPGGNVTGLSLQTEELTGKWFELLKEALPSMTRVAILHHSRTGTTPMKDFEAAARSLGLAPLPLSVQAAPDFKAAFQAANRGRAQGLVLGSSPLFGEHVGELAALARANQLPTIAFESAFAAAGGLMNYGPRITDNYHRAATYIHRILNGTRPSELPVERPRSFYLVINLKTARALGLTIPPSVLFRADHVIE